MTEQHNATRSASSLSSKSSLLARGIGLIGGVSLLSGGVALAQALPSEPGDVPSAQDLLAPEPQSPAVSAPAPVAPPAAQPVLPQSTPTVAPSASAEVQSSVAPSKPASVPSSTVPDRNVTSVPLPDTVSAPVSTANYDTPYIDTTDYSIGATPSREQVSSVVLSERSTGCELTLQQGESIPNSICSSKPTAAIAYRNSSAPTAAVNSFSVGPISVGAGGIQINGNSLMSYFNVTQRPTAMPSNGNIRLLYPLSLPATITSAFGWRVHPISGTHRFHSGTDIGAPMGTPVLAAFDGRVTASNFLGGYGLTVVLQHDNGDKQTLYGHLSEVFVRPGDSVKQGEVIGRVGSTGNSTGPHLHFEVRQRTNQGWIAQNPGALLDDALAHFYGGTEEITLATLPKVLVLSDLSKASQIATTAHSIINAEEIAAKK